MTYKLKRQLKRLSNKQFVEDIKEYIRSPYEFYGKKVPEMKTLARRLHEEHNLKEFYKVFNKLWGSGNPSESSLAIYTLQLYHEEFSLDTWKFIKAKLKDVKSWDSSDIIGRKIVGPLVLKYPKLKKEIIKLSKGKNQWIKRICIQSTFESALTKDIEYSFSMLLDCLNDNDENIKVAIGTILRDLSREKNEDVKRFILKHIDMPLLTFNIATERMRYLRKVRKVKKLSSDKKGFFSVFRKKYQRD
jgi:3-methyladenine DNA glycosylase AlkD